MARADDDHDEEASRRILLGQPKQASKSDSKRFQNQKILRQYVLFPI